MGNLWKIALAMVLIFPIMFYAMYLQATGRDIGIS